MASTPTTQAILQEDGAEAAFIAVREKVHEAEALLTEILQEEPGRPWTVKELYGVLASRRPDIGHTAMGIALGSLEKAGLVHLDASLLLHAS